MQNYTYNYVERTYTDHDNVIYINVIGKKADEIVNRIFNRFFLMNPKIKKGHMGRMIVKKYSFILADYESVKRIHKNIKRVINSPEYRHEIVCTGQDYKNMYVFNSVDFE